jgi:hypothetical protein
MWEIEEQLTRDGHVNWMIDHVSSCPWFLAIQETILDELADCPALFCERRIGNEFRKGDFDDETTVFPFRGVADLDMVVTIAMSFGIVLESDKMQPRSRRHDITLLQMM